ncbi:MAG: LamG-like jellyroll fold domain-containing protein [Anaerolineae bacterium]
MKSVYKFPWIIIVCVSILLNIGLGIVVINLEAGAWRNTTLFLLIASLLLDIYLLWHISVKGPRFPTNVFYILVLVTLAFFTTPFLLQTIQPVSLLLWLLLGLTSLWHLAATLIWGMSSFEQSRFWGRLAGWLEPANLLLLCFSFSLFASIFYELYQRIDYESRREIAVATALERTDVPFDLYAQLFKSIDEPLLKFTHNQNVSVLFQDPEIDYYQMSVETNSLGFRDDEFHPDDIVNEDFVVLFIGDSVTFGVGVEAEQTFVERSESLIADYFQWQESDAKVWHINMGVGSYGLVEAVESLKYVDAPQLKPDVIIYSYNINDYSSQVRGLDQETGALVPFKPRSFFLWDLRQMFRPQSVDQVLNQKLDELVSIADEWEVELVINILPAEPNPKQYPSTFQYDEFKLFAESYQFIHDYIAENQISFVDGLAVFQKESEQEYLLIRPTYRDDGNHYNKLGHQIMGNLVTMSLLDVITTKSSDSLDISLEGWGDYLMESRQFSKARTAYGLLFQVINDELPMPSDSLPKELDQAIEDNLYENLSLYLDFSPLNSSAYFDSGSKLPLGWEWNVLPVCPQDDCSVLNCIETSCTFLDDELGLFVSEESPTYQDFPATGIDGSSGTIMFWYRPDVASADGPPARLLWSYWLDIDNRAYINLNKEEGLQAVFKTATWQIVSSPINWQANEWHHVAMAWDVEFPTVKLYVDGQLVAYSFMELELPIGNGREAFGAWAHDGSAPANGYFGEFLIFPDQLTAFDIEWLHKKSAASYIK